LNHCSGSFETFFQPIDFTHDEKLSAGLLVSKNGLKISTDAARMIVFGMDQSVKSRKPDRFNKVVTS
jgi:hypothetical protein